MSNVDKKVRAAEVRAALLRAVDDHRHNLVSHVAERFGISRQAVYRQVQRLLKQGDLAATGDRRARSYTLVTRREVAHYKVSPNLHEDLVWSHFALPFLKDLKPNVLGICNHGFTEMLNNVVDHSEAPEVTLAISRTASHVELIVIDAGIGIFNKIQRDCHLENPEQALFELSKGKLTTDPNRHSGEGIFFTSRIFDRFSILSGSLWFGHSRDREEDWLTNDFSRNETGTAVFMRIDVESDTSVQRVFEEYSTTNDVTNFDRTVIALDLAGSGPLVSRSQAKRVLSRVSKFREAVLDFKQVQEVGQAFADEIFRVYANEHPGVNIVPINASSSVNQMIARAKQPASVIGETILQAIRSASSEPRFAELPLGTRWRRIREAVSATDPAALPHFDAIPEAAREAVIRVLIDVSIPAD